jgi:hypothetical protein
VGALLIFPTPTELPTAPPAQLPLPRWNEAHRCTNFAEHVHTWRQLTRYGSAVWLVHECQVCGEPYDVLSDQSDERVLTASVYPIWAIAGCEMCAAECAGDACRCPCHGEHITAPDLDFERQNGPDALSESVPGLLLAAGGRYL